MEPTYQDEDQSLGELMREFRDETLTLVKQEVALAKTELGERWGAMRRRLVLLAAGAAVALAALFCLMLGLGDLIASGLMALDIDETTARAAGPAIAGFLGLVAAFALVKIGSKAFAKETITPTHTIASLKETRQWTRRNLTAH